MILLDSKPQDEVFGYTFPTPTSMTIYSKEFKSCKKLKQEIVKIGKDKKGTDSLIAIIHCTKITEFTTPQKVDDTSPINKTPSTATTVSQHESPQTPDQQETVPSENENSQQEPPEKITEDRSPQKHGKLIKIIHLTTEGKSSPENSKDAIQEDNISDKCENTSNTVTIIRQEILQNIQEKLKTPEKLTKQDISTNRIEVLPNENIL